MGCIIDYINQNVDASEVLKLAFLEIMPMEELAKSDDEGDFIKYWIDSLKDLK